MRPSTDGLANYIIWVVIIISFYVLVQAGGGYAAAIAEGFPQWLVILRLVLLFAFLGSMLAIMWQQQWGLWTLFAAVMGRIPLGVAFNHFDSIQNVVDYEINAGWIARMTIYLSIFWAAILWTVLWAIRVRASAE